MVKYQTRNTKKHKKHVAQHIMRDSDKGTHYIYYARVEEEGRAEGRRKGRGQKARKAKRTDYKECTQRGFCLQFIIFLDYFRTFFYFYLVVCLFFATFALRNNKT